MTDLQESFGNIEDEAFLMPYGGPEEPEHGRHHRHHPHKHHYKHPEGPDHGHHHKGHKHHKHHHKHHPEPVPPPPASGANDLSGGKTWSIIIIVSLPYTIIYRNQYFPL